VEATKHPIDLDQIRKGMIISAEYIEDMYGVNRDNRKYQLAVLNLKEFIESGMRARGFPVKCRQHKDTLVVMEDQDASVTISKLFRNNVSNAFRKHREMQEVDTSKLSEQQSATHERNLVIQGAVLSGIADAKKRVVRISPPKKDDDLGAIPAPV